MSSTKNDRQTTIRWTGSAGIEDSQKLKDELKTALNDSTSVLLDLSELQEIDLTGVQILFSAKKEATQNEKNFALVSSVPQQIFDFCETCGVSLNSLF